MKKKTIGRIAALGLAAVTSVSAMSIASSAVVDIEGTYASGSVYAARIDSGNGTRTIKYYTTEAAAKSAVSAAGGESEYVGSVLITTLGTTVYINGTEVSASSSIGGTSYTTRSSGTASTVTPTGYNYATNYAYLGADGYWYPNTQALAAAETTQVSSKALESYEQWSSTNCYFSPINGRYYSTQLDSTEYLVTTFGSGSYSIPSSYRYASSTAYKKNGVWYPNRESLYAATGSYDYDTYHTFSSSSAYSYSSSRIYFDPTDGYYYSTSSGYRVSVSSGSSYYYGYWYSSYTNQYYTTQSAALAASLNNPAYVTYVGDYYNGYYGYGYYNPYWYYYLTNNSTSTSSSSSSSGAVSITGSSSWTSLANSIKITAAGKTISVEMNDETIVPSSVFTALKGKDVTLSLKLSNGVVYRINGKNVTSTKDVNLITTYNTDRVPSTLVKKAYKKYNAVSSAQVSINSNSFGAKVGVTFKFNTKRAGCTARLYRYNSANRTLSLVDTSTVESTGYCTFEGVAKGGDFVVILS